MRDARPNSASKSVSFSTVRTTSRLQAASISAASFGVGWVTFGPGGAERANAALEALGAGRAIEAAAVVHRREANAAKCGGTVELLGQVIEHLNARGGLLGGHALRAAVHGGQRHGLDRAHGETFAGRRPADVHAREEAVVAANVEARHVLRARDGGSCRGRRRWPCRRRSRCRRRRADDGRRRGRRRLASAPRKRLRSKRSVDGSNSRP